MASAGRTVTSRTSVGFSHLWITMDKYLHAIRKPRTAEQRPHAIAIARVRVSKPPVAGGYFIQQGRAVMLRKPLDTLPRSFPRVPAPRYDRPCMGVGDPRTIKTKI